MFESFFGQKATPTPAPAPAPTPASSGPTPGNMQQVTQTTKTSAGTDNNGVVPDSTTTNKSDAKPEAPLAQFADLWKDKPTDSTDKKPANFFDVDPVKVMEAAKKQDFSKVIKQENLKKIAAGGEDAVQAFAETFNELAQHMYGQSAIASTKIAEAAYNKAKADMESSIPGLVKKQQTAENLRSKNPNFKNPALQPVIDAVSDKLVLKYPNASQDEIHEMATQYLTQAAGILNPTKQSDDSSGRKGSSETDWSKFLEE